MRAMSGDSVWLEEALQRWREQDASAAFAGLEASGAAADVAERYRDLAQHLYNDRQDLAGMILAARAGIHFCLDRARPLEAADPPAAEKLRGLAKAIAYNLGANCWPGWMDDGIVITTTERAIGQRFQNPAAELCTLVRYLQYSSYWRGDCHFGPTTPENSVRGPCSKAPSDVSQTVISSI